MTVDDMIATLTELSEQGHGDNEIAITAQDEDGTDVVETFDILSVSTYIGDNGETLIGLDIDDSAMEFESLSGGMEYEN